MTYVSTRPMNEVVTLYRGEYPSKQYEISRAGVSGRPSDLGDLHLHMLPPELLVHAAYDKISNHVLVGSARSPMKSWSRSALIAMSWATSHNTRRGLLLTAQVRIVRHHVWSTPSGWSHGYVDGRGRVLLPTGALRTGTIQALSRPDVEERIRVLGNVDQEFLVLGAIAAHEIGSTLVKHRRTA